MAQLLVAAAGAAVGFAVGGPTGAQIGWALGSLAGSALVPGPNTKGPRLTDAKVTGVDYGEPIPWIAGTYRVAGQIWWASDVREISTTTQQGKGGGATTTTYTYESDILYGLCSREITGVRRIWANGKLVWSMHADSSDETIAAQSQAPWDDIAIYTGASDQLPDPTYEAAVGAGNAPAYRGRGTVVISGLQLGNSGIPPVLTFEVVVDGSFDDPLTILQSYFDNDVSDDISAFRRGAGVLTEYTSPALTSNAFHVFSNDGAGDRGAYLYWQSEDFSLRADGTPLTIEFFITVGAARNVSYDEILSYWGDISSLETFVLAMENGTLLYDDATFGIQYYGNNLVGAGRTHIAVVFDGSGGGSATNLYVNGQQVYSTVPISGGVPGTVGRVRFGALIQGAFDSYAAPVDYTIDSFRVRLEAVYTANFTPPTEIPPPDGYRLTPDLATLRGTVEELCDRAGMLPSELDAAALDDITKPVRGLVVAQMTSTRAVLEQLQSAYFFNSFAADKLYFIPRGGSVVEDFDVELMAAAENQALDEILAVEQQNDTEVAAQVSVTYANVEADYNSGAELSDRILSTAVTVQGLPLGIAFTPSEAKGIADAAVLDGYVSRISAKAQVPYASYAELTPTDVVRVPDEDGNLYRMRIVTRTDNGPATEFDLVLDDASVLDSAGITSEDYTSTVEVATFAQTSVYGMDIPLLRDADDTLGHYIAAKPSSIGTTWPGVGIYRSVDGYYYELATQVLERAVMGETRTALGDFNGGVVFDEVNSLTVDVGAGELSSSTRTAMLNDTTINALLVGDEIIRFMRVTGSGGVYVLTGLLRGQLGTEWAMGSHAIGETVVLLRTAGIRSITVDTASLGVVRYYAGVTLGGSLQNGTFYQFTCDGVRKKPLSPVQLRALTNSSGDEIAVTWNRRTRLSSTFTGPAGSVVPIGETTETYRIRVLDGDTAVVSDFATTNAYTLEPASPGDYDGMTLEVCQLSSTSIAGYAATLTL